MLRTMICVILLALTMAPSAFADVEVACQEPNYGVAVVDGNYAEWGLNSDFFTNMLHHWTGTKVLAKLYLRYDCAENMMYALVLTADVSRTLDTTQPDGEPESWIKINDNDNFAVNENYGAEFFRWIDKVGDRAVGWEAKFPHNLNLCTLKAHSNVWWSGESQTAGSSDISMCVTCPTLGAIGDYVWHDANFNGLQDDGAMNVVGITNITLTLVKLDDAGNALEEYTTQTDANGWYLFSNLTAGRYFVDVDERDDDMPSTGGRKWVHTQLTSENKHDPHCVQLADGQVYLQADFGFAGLMNPALGTIGDYTWWDEDDNNQQWHDPNVPDLELPYVIVSLYTSPGNVLSARGKTDRYGNYLFYNVPFGDYVVRIDEAGPSKPYMVESMSSTIPFGEIGGLMKGGVGNSMLAKINGIEEAPYWEVYNWQFTGEPPYGNDHFVRLTADNPNYLDADFPWLEEDPIGAMLVSFTATIVTNGVQVRWQTAQNSGAAGYNLLRGEQNGAGFVPINRQLISAEGSVYELIDGVDRAGTFQYCVEQIGFDGQAQRSDAISVTLSSEVVTAWLTPADFALYPNHPNPFNPQTTLRFALPRDERVKLAVYDLNGKQVRLLVDGQLPAGEHAVIWDGLDGRGLHAPSGAYLYRIAAGEFLQTRKMVLIR